MDQVDTTKILPNSKDAERAILGAILLDNKLIYKVLSTLDGNDFYTEANRRIYTVMGEMETKNKPIDILTVKEELYKKDQLESVGGITYLSQLTDGISPLLNIEYYAEIVHEKAVLRKIISMSSESMTRSYQDTELPGEILDSIEKEVL